MAQENKAPLKFQRAARDLRNKDSAEFRKKARMFLLEGNSPEDLADQLLDKLSQAELIEMVAMDLFAAEEMDPPQEHV